VHLRYRTLYKSTYLLTYVLMSYTDVRRHLLEACCLEATKAVSDGPISERSWVWFHFLHQLLFTDGRQMSTAAYV